MALRKKFILFLFLQIFILSAWSFATGNDPDIRSSRKDALDFLKGLDKNKKSDLWPNVKSTLFYEDLKLNLENPESFYPGRSTNFCAYGALSYILVEKDPLAYVRFMDEMYKNGVGILNGNRFKPARAVLEAAGTLRFKGVLDIRHAEQMWFLVLADKFKGYLNIFNQKFNEGDENSFWAATNFAKFNRMIRKLCHLKVKAAGSDLIKPWIKDPFAYIRQELDNNNLVALYVNNRVIHKKNHVRIKFSIPTHFIILNDIWQEDDVITLHYWDYGTKKEIHLSPAVFKKIIFGISIVST